MFKKNTSHQQPALISAASDLPEKQRKRLESSWAATFYQEFFSRIDESAFAVLYSEIGSRPNVPVNVLVGLEALKAGFGWSDQELYEHYCYDLQVRYAVGYDRLGDGDFEIRSLYYFRERLSRYNAEKSINLLEKAFEQITDAQIVSLKIRTGMQRMDSTQIASNIVSASRLQLLVEGIQRVERILNEADKTRLAETLAPYLKDSAGHYTYRVKGKQAVDEHLQAIGQTIHSLLQDLKTTYASENAYRVLERLFAENFHLLPEGAHPKENTEISSGCLQSVDDLEASYRTKGTGHYKGFVANITETCDPENEIQLITKVQVAPNNTDDGQLLAEALPNLKARTNLDTLVWQARFDPAICATCPFQQSGRCPSQPQKRDPRYLLNFTTPEIRTAKRRQNHRKHLGDSHNLRSAVEATVRSVKHPFPAGKLPVRGIFRVTCMAIASAATANLRRIQRHFIAKTKQDELAKSSQSADTAAALVSFFLLSFRFLRSRLAFNPTFGY